MQVAIDGCKKTFSVDANAEIARIRSMRCMNHMIPGPDGVKMVKKDLPLFWQYTHEVAVTKNGKERDYEDVRKDRNRIKNRIDESCVCPMNCLQEWLDKIQGVDRKNMPKVIDTRKFYIPMTGKADARQMSKIRKIIEEYDAFTRANIHLILEYQDAYEVYITKTEELLNEIRSLKLSCFTINRLIGTVLGIDRGVNHNRRYGNASKYVMKTLNLMYKADKNRFLSNFVS